MLEGLVQSDNSDPGDEYTPPLGVGTTTFNSYQSQTAATAVYPPNRGIEYLALGLCGESGEVAEEIKKAIRSSIPFSDEDLRSRMRGELGDVLWYLAQLAKKFGLSLEDIASNNLSKLQGRKSNGTLRDSR